MHGVGAITLKEATSGNMQDDWAIRLGHSHPDIDVTFPLPFLDCDPPFTLRQAVM